MQTAGSSAYSFLDLLQESKTKAGHWFFPFLFHFISVFSISSKRMMDGTKIVGNVIWKTKQIVLLVTRCLLGLISADQICMIFVHISPWQLIQFCIFHFLPHLSLNAADLRRH